MFKITQGWVRGSLGAVLAYYGTRKLYEWMLHRRGIRPSQDKFVKWKAIIPLTVGLAIKPWGVYGTLAYLGGFAVGSHMGFRDIMNYYVQKRRIEEHV